MTIVPNTPAADAATLRAQATQLRTDATVLETQARTIVGDIENDVKVDIQIFNTLKNNFWKIASAGAVAVGATGVTGYGAKDIALIASGAVAHVVAHMFEGE